MWMLVGAEYQIWKLPVSGFECEMRWAELKKNKKNYKHYVIHGLSEALRKFIWIMTL